MTIEQLEEKLKEYTIKHKEESGIFWVDYKDFREALKSILEKN